jgi:RHS repeat-associated protein
MVNGHFVPTASGPSAVSPESADPGAADPGAADPGAADPGAVKMARPPRPPRFPVRGAAADKVRVLRAPAAAVKAGYNPRTSRELAPRSATQVVYSNADGSRSAFEYALPVNYQRRDGTWAPISTTLVPQGPSSSSAPRVGWTERSEAEPEVFAPYANAADLVTVPLSSGHAVAFGIANAASVPGASQGSSVTYAGAMPDSAIRFTAGTGTVKEQIQLDSPHAPTTWIFPLDLTGLRARLGPAGVVEFADAAGKVLAYVPRGFMSDSNINPHSGDGATSWGVTYSLTTVDGRQAITMTLDTAWLHSKARVFPVTVDPSVSDVNSDGTTYVQYPDTNDFSGDTEMHVGTWDGGSDKAESYVAFTNVASSLKNDTVLGAYLGVFNTWSYSCEPRAVYVYPVTSSWTVTGNKSWPGPSTGAAIGRASFANGYVEYGSTSSNCPARWENIKLDQAGTNLVDGWTHGTVADDGLALGASATDSYSWKKFASHASGSGNPYLDVTYTTDGASYRLAARKPLVQVLPAQNGKFAIQVTNTGSSTWTPANGYEISYRVYNAAGKLYANHPVFTAMPSTVAPGQTVTVDAVVDALPAGAYAINFDMYSGATGSSPVSFSSQGIRPYAIGLNIPQPPPVISGVYPPDGFISATLRQQLATIASTASGTITYSFKLTCEPPSGQTCAVTTVSSGSITKPYWTPPATSMQWNMPYQWSVTTTVNGSSTSVSGISLEPEVPQPGMTAGLGDTSGQAYDPLSGNYTTSATEAAVATAGVPLRITRTYNSLDPRTSLAFGAGWSSVIDMGLRADNDSTGNSHDSTGDVVVTLSDGKQVRFGENGDGSYAPPFGSKDTLVHNISAATWTLRDSSGDQYTFTSAGQISKIIDQNGRSLLFTGNSSGQVATITDSASGRTLTLTWTKPAGAAYSHVSSIATQPPVSGQQAYIWTYGYGGDDLTGVCSPVGNCTATSCPVGCTGYSYQTGSHYLSGVLDSGARSYWQLGEAAGSATAADEVDSNLGTTDGTYSNVTLGVAGPLAGSDETAAGFNGTSSSVSLPSDLITDSTDESVELWFKGASSTASGVLFSADAQPLSKASGDHEPVLYVGGNGELYGEFWNGSVDPVHTSYSVDDGKWHYVVLTASSSTQSMYLDNKLIGSVSGNIDNLNETLDAVGAGLWTSWPENTKGGQTTSIGYFDGDIGQVAVYPHPLAVPDIATHYALGTVASPELTQVTLQPADSSKPPVVYEKASYDPATDRLESYTDPNGGAWTIGQPLSTGYRPTADSLGEVVDHVTVTDPANNQDTYSYDMLDEGRLIEFSNGIDAPQSYGYDAAGFLATVVNQDGDLVCFTNDSHGNVLTRTWYPLEPTSLPGGGIGTITSCGGSTSSSATCTGTGAACTTFYGYFYNSANPLDPRNNELTSARDGRSANSADNTYLTQYAYNAQGQLTTQTSPPTSDFPNGRVTSYTYSAGTEAGYSGGTIPAGLLLTKTTPGGAKTTYKYYSDGDLAEVIEPSGRYTVYTYDALGRVVTGTLYTNTDSSGATTEYTYDAVNRPLMVQYAAATNQVTGVAHTLVDTYTYDDDPGGNLLSYTQSDLTGGDPSRTTTYTYNDHGQMATQTQPAGATPAAASSPATGASSPDPEGATTGYEYDAFGNITKRIDPNGNEYRYSYNEYNERTQVLLYTPATSESTPMASCTAPATQDPDGGCDLVVDSYSYDPAGLLASATDALGRITSYGYDNNQEPQTVLTTDPSTSPSTGRKTTYGYDGAGNRIIQDVSALSGNLVGATTVTAYTYDAADRLTSVVADQGTGSGYANRTTAYTYDADNHVLSQTVGTAAQGGPSVTDYTYDTAGDKISQTVMDGSTSLKTTWTFDQNGLPLSKTIPAGNASGATAADYTTNYAYDPLGHLESLTGPPVQTQTYAAQIPAATRPVTTYGYDSFGDQTQVVDPDNNRTTTGYDGDGRVTSVLQAPYTQPGSSSSITQPTTYAYDEAGNLVQATDPAGNVTQYGYDALGDVTSVTQPQLPGQSAPGVWHYTYDAAGEQLSAADPLGNTTQSTYNYFGELASSTDALDHTTSYAYDYLGDLTTVTSPDGVVTTAGYDHLGEQTSVADSRGDTTGYAYDYAGRLGRVTNPDGSYAQYGYDEAGDQTSVTDYGAAASGQTAPQLRTESFGYDLNGERTSVKDWNGNTTNYTYDAAGELTSQVEPITSTTSVTTSHGYDPAGNPTSLTSGNGNTTWTTYNSWKLPESVIKPATAAASAAADRTWTTGYDADGRPVSVSQPGGITQSYGYDPLGDLTSQAGSGASAATPTQTLTYDLDGRLASATAPGGTDTFSYDANGQLKSAAGPSGTSGFSYNNDGLLSSQTGPGGTTSYTYDSADRLATVADPLTGATSSYGYNADSLPTSIGYSVNGTAGSSQALTYDSLNRLASDTLTSSTGATLAAQTYGYDNNGNLTSQTTAGLAGAGSTTYTYDEANRLASATTGGTVTDYAYDGDGNLTQAGGASYAYNPQDQLTSSTTSGSTTSYAYTLSGALSSVTPAGGSAQGYTSDAFGNLIAAPGGITYGYDALGRLVSRTASSGTTSLSYLGTGSTVASDGTDNYSYTPSGAMVAAGAVGGTGYSTLSDLHGDVTATFNPAAGTTSLAGSAAYSPYGTVTATSGAMPALGYQGAYTDPATGLVDMGARWYDPATGSFATSDAITGSPVPSTLDGNPYAYTSGDPLVQTDPTGHECFYAMYGMSCFQEPGQGTLNPPGVVGGGQSGGGSGLIGGTLAAGLSIAALINDLGGPAAPYSPTSPGSDNAINGATMNWLDPYGWSGAPMPWDWGHLGPYPIGPYPSSSSPPTAGTSPHPVYVPPPPPPPDCYAGPAATCKPPEPPASLRGQKLITSPAYDSTNVRDLFKNREGITETLKPKHHKIAGTTPNAAADQSPSHDETGDNISDVTKPLNGIGVPTTPGVPNPVNGGDINEPSTSGGNKHGGGGGGQPPTSNGGCEDPSGNPAAEDNGANNPNAAVALNRKLSALQNAQQNAASVRELPDGRIRYYGPETSARTAGPTRGASYVTEWDPGSGFVRSWLESYDRLGNVVRVHPKMLNGQALDAPHFPPIPGEC